MELSRRIYHACRHCIWFGPLVMPFALFLHPMNPDDFFLLALSDPLASMRDAYGIQAAVLFWIGVALIMAGAAGLLCSLQFFLKSTASAPRSRTKTDYAEENWSFL